MATKTTKAGGKDQLAGNNNESGKHLQTSKPKKGAAVPPARKPAKGK